MKNAIKKMPIERPKKQKLDYSFKYKMHSMKCQVVVKNKQIICTAVAKGKTHEFITKPNFDTIMPRKIKDL